ncbi:MAG: heme biosynthesis HemY N-terminal domain-containing protein [Ketobacteraceae bacterium]|nr:heme biosynthesis HemY N-terminal domain-containing protein [Ketobacteraceae bacterium]
MTSLFRAVVFKPSTIIFLVFGASLIAMFVARQSSDPGYLLFSLGNYTFETSAIVATIGFLLLVTLVFWIYRGAEWLVDKSRLQHGARKRTTKGLIAYAEGNWSEAEKVLVKAASRHEVPLINYITAAKAAHEQGKDERRDDYLRLAHETTKGVDSAIGLTKARLQFDSGQWEQCLATLMMLKKDTRSPGYTSVLKMLAQVYVRLEDWENLRGVLPEIKKRRLLAKEEYLALAETCYEGLIKSQSRNSPATSQLQQLKQAWSEVPRAARQNPALLHAYCSRLMELGAEQEAERVITAFLKKDWDDQLVRLYGIVKGEDLEKQKLLAENWLQERPNNAMLLLTLGRLSMQLQQWEKARSYFESSLSSRKTAEAYGELGRLLGYLGDHKESSEYFQKGLAMISQRLPDLPLPTAED